jgi:NapC/NirT cytochrome c family, N-terminal region
MEKNKLPRLLYNWISALGAVIAAVCGLVIVFALILSAISGTINPYLGILLYMALPALLVGGLLLVPLGMYLAWRKGQTTGETPSRLWPSIDLNNVRQRHAAVIFVLGTFLFLLMSSVGMYQAYHFTESLAFCGLTCHTVMKPEYTAYQDSPHARVKCVECHIGPGAGWYARSKLSGLYQVYAVLAKVYPRPIPTPIKDLRPAQETCEQCHWPRQFFGAKQKQFDHYLYNKENTHWPVNMLIKIGGGSPTTGQTAGIHWHMNIESKVEYIARDKSRQDIPWIRATDKQTGRVTVYQDTAHPLMRAELAAATPRRMDCMDCHNRPSHDFHSPDYEADLAILTGRITPSLPEIKKAVVNAMTGEYTTEEAARDGIARAITNFYRVTYPAVYAQKGEAIHHAVATAQEAYARNIFPAMRAKWSDYPDNIGHFIFPGCMRCHDGTHRSGSGAIIPHDCRTCHIILSEGANMRAEMINTRTGLEFVHPVDIGSAWKDGTCYTCHSGTQP